VAISFLYGPEHQRIREVSTKTSAGVSSHKTLAVLHPDNEGALYFERETIHSGPGANTSQNRHYLSAEKGSFLLVTSNGPIQSQAQQNASLGSPAALANAEYKYWHKDHLGSIVASTSSSNALIERMAYEPFGKRRFTNGQFDQTGTIDAQSTIRGFTGHEHLDELDFIHMNARVYDPDIHRFLSPDPTVAHANNPQSFNRYSYGYNNPLNVVDPTGFTVESRSPEAKDVSSKNDSTKAGDSDKGRSDDVTTDSINKISGDGKKGVGGYTAGDEQSQQLAQGMITDPAKRAGPPPPAGASMGGQPARPATTPCSVPNPDGRKGGEAHQQEVEKAKQELQNKYKDNPKVEVRTEVKIETPGGEKGSRFMDVAVVNKETGKIVEATQVDKAKKDDMPVAREQRAINDVKKVEPDLTVNFRSYNQNQKKK
jgi:RHS repeat-associated protein